MTLKSIKTRIVSFSIGCILFTVASLVGYGIYSNTATSRLVAQNVDQILDTKSRDALRTLASTQAGILRAEADSAFDAARIMARAAEMMAGTGTAATAPEKRRDQLNALLLSVLKDNPRFNGTYSAWAPDALDGNDQAHRGKADAGSDATGRALPYWTRDTSGKIALQPLVEYDSAELHPNGLVKGGWFIDPSKTGKESILAPLPYIVQGKAVFLATMSVPVMVDGTFRGVVGADFDLSFVQNWPKPSMTAFMMARGPSPSSPRRGWWWPPALIRR